MNTVPKTSMASVRLAAYSEHQGDFPYLAHNHTKALTNPNVKLQQLTGRWRNTRKGSAQVGGTLS